MGYKSPHLITYPVHAPTVNPVDSTTYYFGSRFTDAMTTSALYYKIYMQRNGILRGLELLCKATAGSAEDTELYIRLNNTTDYTITTTLKWNVALQEISKHDLNIPVSQGDFIEFKFITAAWAANPANVVITGTLLQECE